MTAVHERLNTIRATLRAIHDMTARLGTEPDQEDLRHGLQQRASLVSSVVEERSRLDEEHGDWKELVARDHELASANQEIEERFRSITEMDALLLNRLQQQMHATREELRGLHGSSRAACAYTAQSFTARSRSG